jgi:hypothetical protein
MKSIAAKPGNYIDGLPSEWQPAVKKLRSTIKKNLPSGFKEGMCYGMIGYVVPHSKFPAGYHCNPDQPLMLINIGLQKNYLSIHHMGLYFNKPLVDWFVKEHVKATGKKPDMGKACIHYRKPSDIPYNVFALLARKITPEEWINWYLAALSVKRK